MIEQKVCNCLVGHLDFGYPPKNLTAKEYLLWMERDEKVVERHFEKFHACPRCGRKIDWWDDERF